jgi:hypothetical protein
MVRSIRCTLTALAYGEERLLGVSYAMSFSSHLVPHPMACLGLSQFYIWYRSARLDLVFFHTRFFTSRPQGYTRQHTRFYSRFQRIDRSSSE